MLKRHSSNVFASILYDNACDTVVVALDARFFGRCALQCGNNFHYNHVFTGNAQKICTDALKQVKVAFSHAVHGYITLLDMEWEDMFRCRCEVEVNAKGRIVYDNACNAVCFAQYRVPRLFDKYAVQCDNFHHKHGSSGNGHNNCGSGTTSVHAGLQVTKAI